MYKLYVASFETNELVATIEADDMITCEIEAGTNYGANDYYWSFTPAFGTEDGMIEVACDEIVIK